jgi:hypothetical protein
MAVLRGLAPALRSNWGAQRRGHGAGDLSRSAFSVLSEISELQTTEHHARCRHENVPADVEIGGAALLALSR